MEYRLSHVNNFSGLDYFSLPKICPNCGQTNNPTTQVILPAKEINSTGIKVGVLSHYCPLCAQTHLTTQIKESSSTNHYDCVACYPKPIAKNIDPVFIKYAPNFVKYYSEAMVAENEGLTNLAGMGLRAAIECLVKDYALYAKLDTKEEIAKQSFNNCIDKYINDDQHFNGTVHYIRKVGNDFTHWDNKYNQDYSMLKTYVDIVVSAFYQKFMMMDRPL